MQHLSKFSDIIDQLNSGRPIIIIERRSDDMNSAFATVRIANDEDGDTLGDEGYIGTPDREGKWPIGRSGFSVVGGSEYTRIMDRAEYMLTTPLIKDGQEIVIIERWRGGMKDNSAPCLTVHVGTVRITQTDWHYSDAGYVE